MTYVPPNFVKEGVSLGKQIERLRVLAEIEAHLRDWSGDQSEIANHITTVLLNLGVFVAGGEEGTASKAALAWLTGQGFEGAIEALCLKQVPPG